MWQPDGAERPDARRGVEAEPVLDLPAVRASFLDDLPEAEAAGPETGSNLKLDNELGRLGGIGRGRGLG